MAKVKDVTLQYMADAFKGGAIGNMAEELIAYRERKPKYWANEGSIQGLSLFGDGSIFLTNDPQEDQTIPLYIGEEHV